MTMTEPLGRSTSSMLKVLQPQGWIRPKGYSNGISAKGRLVFVSGTIGWDEQGKLVSTDFAEQTQRALQNIVRVLAEGGARPEHIVRMNWLVLDKREYIGAFERIGVIYREIIGNHYPAMTAAEVSALMEDGARVEIEVTAVVPD